MNASRSADLYAGTRARLTDAALGFSPETLDDWVPACPEWTVHNLICHLAGVATDFVAGNIDGAPRPPWTAVQVNARRSVPIDAVLDEWATTGPALEQLILSGSDLHPLVGNPYIDSGTHEADLHGALGIGRPPRSSGWRRWSGSSSIRPVRRCARHTLDRDAGRYLSVRQRGACGRGSHSHV